MTPFEQLKALYHQFFNLAAEIKSMVDASEYNEAISKLQYKDSLIEELVLMKKNIALDDEEQAQISLIENELKAKEKENITLLIRLRDEVSAELKKTNKNLKVNSAYIVGKDNKQGSMIDFSE